MTSALGIDSNFNLSEEKPLMIYDEGAPSATKSHTMPVPQNGILEKIITEAVRQGVPPLEAIAIGHKETNFGTYTSGKYTEKSVFENPMQLLYGLGRKQDERIRTTLNNKMMASEPLDKELEIPIQTGRSHFNEMDISINKQDTSIEEGIRYYKEQKDLNDGSIWHGYRNYNGSGEKAVGYANKITKILKGYNSPRNKPFRDYVNQIASRVEVASAETE